MLPHARRRAANDRLRGETRGADDQRIRNIVEALQISPAYGVRELARMVNLSPSRLSHLFKSETSSSLQSFLSDCRLQKAAELLLGTETPIKEISYMVGYSHPSSLVRAFRHKFHCRPNDFRSRARNDS